MMQKRIFGEEYPLTKLQLTVSCTLYQNRKRIWSISILLDKEAVDLMLAKAITKLQKEYSDAPPLEAGEAYACFDFGNINQYRRVSRKQDGLRFQSIDEYRFRRETQEQAA